jgi:hypothetical protein
MTRLQSETAAIASEFVSTWEEDLLGITIDGRSLFVQFPCAFKVILKLPLTFTSLIPPPFVDLGLGQIQLVRYLDDLFTAP